MTLPLITAIWIGDKLNPLSAACLRSFVVAGHRTRLYSYGNLGNVPDGVETADAATILPEAEMIRLSSGGKFSLFSNIFRYELLQRVPSIYVDCDVYCLKPLQPAEIVLGYERDSSINGAVLGLEPDSELLQDLRRSATPAFIPPWLKPRHQMKMRIRQWIGRPRPFSETPWGTLGPRLITHFVNQRGLHHHVKPADVFYPVDADRISLLYDPDIQLKDLTTHRTSCVHLYNEVMRRAARDKIPPTSPLGQILQPY
ncbi:hypothetical protein [Kaistia granuli]|uniref:hypothetical protein n=1 Tax=Kaistia granuli TaxID=363259 RepID=UPI000361695F|nr:hypothetical protein [Kaistia granuli]